MPAALLLDLDDTLLDDRGAMSAAVLAFRAKHDLIPEVPDEALASQWDEAGRSLWRRLAANEVTFEEQRRMRLRTVFNLRVSDEEADGLFADYLNLYEQHWTLLPGALEFIAASSHLPRIIVTNGRRRQAQRKLDKCGLAMHFTGLVTPDDCGARKPDLAIFRHALSLLEAKAEDTMMIGDNLESDIAPARELGMRVFHVNHLNPAQSIRHALSAA